jgi:hypothetical protein
MTTFVFKNAQPVPVEDGDREWRQVPGELVPEYTEVAMRTGAHAEDAREPELAEGGVPIVGIWNVDTNTVTEAQPDASMIVLDEDTDGFSHPTTRNGPGY